MGAKFKSRTHLLKTFVEFWCHLFARLASKFEKTIFFQIKPKTSYKQNKFDEHE
jgi:hypothetical protein